MESAQTGGRSFLRHPVDIPIEIEAEDVRQREPRRLKDVSLGGLACRSERPLTIGAGVVVTIPLVTPVFHAPCSVVWCRRHGSHYEVGIRFTQVEDIFAARMVGEVCQVGNYRQEVRRLEGGTLDGERAAQEGIARYEERCIRDRPTARA